MANYIQRKYREWLGVFSKLGALFGEFRRWSSFTWAQRGLLVLAVLGYSWQVVLPAVLVPLAIVFFAWLAFFYQPA
jgi:uncharacterized membrane protein YfbV (UPF0208 family)